MTFNVPTDKDYALLNQLDQIRAAARQTETTATPAAALTLSTLTRLYPGISPGLAYALSSSGNTAIAHDAWQAELASRIEPGTRQKPKPKQSDGGSLWDYVPVVGAIKGIAEGKSPAEIALRAIPGAKLTLDVEKEHVLPAAGQAIQTGESVVNQALQNTENQPNQISGLPSYRQDVQDVAATAQAGYEGTSAVYRQIAPQTGVDLSAIGINNAPLNGSGPLISHESPGQAVSAVVDQTVLGQMIQGKSAGTGFLPAPDSPANQAAAAAARKYSPYLIGGHAWTPGRALAGTVLEPDSTAFKIASGVVDAGVQLETDPTLVGLNQLAEARAAGKLFVTDDLARESGGLFAGIRDRFSPKGFSQFQASTAGQRFADAVAAESDPWTISHATGIPNYITAADGSTVPIIRQLADATTPEQVWQTIEPHVGTTNAFREVPEFRAPGYGSRLLADVPRRVLPVGPDADLNEAAKVADDALINSRASLEDRKAMWDTFARVDPRDRAGLYAGVDQLFDLIKKQLVLNGAPEDKAAELATWERQGFGEIANYGIDAQGQQLINPYFVQDGEAHPVPSPIFDNQFLNNGVVLPNARAISRAVSPNSPIFDDNIVKGVENVADLAMVPWRRLMLMRPAWGVRVVADEALRMAADGYSSILSSHPLRAISYAIGSPDSRWITKLEEIAARNRGTELSAEEVAAGAEFPTPTVGQRAAGKAADVLSNVKRTVGRGAPSTFTYLEDDPYMQAHMLRGDARFQTLYDQNPQAMISQFGLTHPNEAVYPKAVVEEMMRLRDSGIAQQVVQSENPEALKDWFWSGEGKTYRDYMASDPRLAPMGGDTDSARLAADAQMDIASQAVQTATGNRPALIDALRTGEIDGVPLQAGLVRNSMGDIIGGHSAANPDAINKVAEMVANGEDLPTTIRIRRWLQLSESDKTKTIQHLNSVTRALFDALMPRPSDYLSRSPVFAQAWWQRQSELMPYMDSATRSRLVSELDVANMGRDPIATKIRDIDTRLTALGDNAPEAKITNFADADTIAKQFALDKVRTLLHDFSDRTQVADMARLIAPFGDAWKQVIEKWSKIAYENPDVLRQIQNAYWQVRQPGSDVVNTATGGISEGGFFHKDSFGQEVFTYPGSQLITKSLLGTPIPLTGQVKGLNMVGEGIPALGPAVSVPLSYLLPDKPSTDWIANQLYPFGRPNAGQSGVLGMGDSILQEYLPTWAKRLTTAGGDPSNDRLYANTVFDVARYLESTGKYDIQGPNAQTEINRLLTDAKTKAKGLFVIRAMGSFTTPASPSPEWLTHDSAGHLTLAWKLTDWYNKEIKKTGSVSQATDNFLTKFGADNLLNSQPESKAVVPAAPTTKDAGDWFRSNPDLVAKYPISAGLFAPTTGGFDQATYEAQFARGQRVQLTPEEMVRLANARLGNLLYNKAKDNGANTATLATLRQELTDEFPGYATGSPIASYKTADVISELTRAARDPQILKTQAGQALGLYLAERAAGISQAQNLGLTSPWTAAKAYPIRLALYNYGESLVQQYPSFQPIWDQVFNREIK
jgi:hypothetical protein